MDRGPRLSKDHRKKLDFSFTVEDIKRILDVIPSSKAPGMDDFNSHFFKTSWETVKKDIHNVITYFFSTWKILREVSVISITLVPKVKVPS